MCFKWINTNINLGVNSTFLIAGGFEIQNQEIIKSLLII